MIPQPAFVGADLTHTLGTAPTQPLIDAVGATCLAAYSSRKLRTLYTGYAARIRRSSDNTTLDVGFDVNGDFDSAAALTFCGAGNGFLAIAYDQSGNVRDASQATAANQPQIIASGVLLVQNLRAAFYTPDAARGLLTTSFTAYTGTTLAAGVVAASTATVVDAVGQRILSVLGTSTLNDTNDGTGEIVVAGLYPNYQTYRAAALSHAAMTVGMLQQIDVLSDGTNNNVRVDGVSGANVASSGAFNFNRIGLMGKRNSTTGHSSEVGGYHSELVLWSSLTTTQRATQRTNQKAYFGTV